MGPRRCCCNAPCRIGEDDFNRADSTDPGIKWHIISGEWAINSNQLVATTPGQLATTICHPPPYLKGSYVARVDLIGMSDGSVSEWEVWIGDPDGPDYSVTVSHNSGASTATLSLFDRVGLIHAETYSGVSTDQELQICWAPGMMVSAFLGGFEPHIDDCTGVTGDDCYPLVGTDGIGGWSFVRGRFDNWIYDVHYIENQNCEACSCFCWRSSADYSCFPDSLTLTFESVGSITSTFPDITLFQSFGSPAFPWPNKTEGWNSNVYNCGSPVGAEFAFRFLCARPFGGISLTPLTKDYDTAGGGQIVWSWTSGGSPSSSARFANFDASTCDPLSIVFPEIQINSAFPGPGCDFGEFPSGGYQPYCGSRSGDCFATPPDIRFIPRIVV